MRKFNFSKIHKHLESHLNNYRVKIAQRAIYHDGREKSDLIMTKKFFTRGHKFTIQKTLDMLQTLQNVQDPCNKEEIPDPTLFPAIFKRD